MKNIVFLIPVMVAAAAVSARSYPQLNILIYDQSRTFPGNVIFVDKLSNRIVEADLEGNIIWDCPGPVDDKPQRPGSPPVSRLMDVELLPNDHVFVLNAGTGVYELDRNGEMIWAYENETVSHDADRLENGGAVMACVEAE